MLKQEIVQRIRETFSGLKVIHQSHLKMLSNDVLKELESELLLCPEYENIRNIVYCIVKGINLPLCKTCSRPLSFNQYLHKHEYCSAYCRDHSPCVQSKRVGTVRSKYKNGRIGGRIKMSDEERKRIHSERKCQHDMELYGQTGLTRDEKRHLTMIKKYGVKAMLCTPYGKEKAMAGLIDKYGENPFFKIWDEWKEKREAIIENDPCFYKNNQKKAMLSYARSTFRKLKKRWENEVEPLFTEDEYVNFHKTYKWKCVHCGNEFESAIYTTDFSIVDRYMPRCLKCHPYDEGYSIKEKAMTDFVKSIYAGEIIENDRIMINPFELDVYIPLKYIAIEFDGDFWHSDAVGKDKHYHIKKTELCSEKGIRLIHIFEHEWDNKQNIVKDRIKSALGIYDRRIYARKCIVHEIDIKDANDFLERNHLQGACCASVCLGLYHGNELVSVMTFGKPRFNKEYDWEMIRFSSCLGTQVIGGAGKLLAYFRKSYAGTIISYADRRYSDGGLYRAIGFHEIGVSDPNYVWVNGKGAMLSRYKCQKHLLEKVIGDKFNPSLSESENMTANGYMKVYDCGNLIYVLE